MVKDVCRMGSSNRAVEGFLVQQVPLVCLFGELSSRTLFQVFLNKQVWTWQCFSALVAACQFTLALPAACSVVFHQSQGFTPRVAESLEVADSHRR